MEWLVYERMVNVELIKVAVDGKKCIGCGKCVNDCPSKALKIENGKAVYSGKCLECGHCVAICPMNAVVMPEMDMSEVVEYRPGTFDLDPEKLLNTMKFRRSIRNFRSDIFKPADLERLLMAGRYAPTAKNTQATKFIVVQKELAEFKKLFWEMLPAAIEELNSEGSPAAPALERFLYEYIENRKDNFFFNAPALILIVTDNPWDGGLAVDNIELMACAMGAGVLHSGYLKRSIPLSAKLMRWLGIEGRTVSCCMLAGYPAEKYCRTAPRKRPDFTVR